MDEIRAEAWMQRELQDRGLPEDEIHRSAERLRMLGTLSGWQRQKSLSPILETMFQAPEASNGLGINRYRDRLWFHRESFLAMLNLLRAAGMMEIFWERYIQKDKDHPGPGRGSRMIREMNRAMTASEYRVDRLFHETEKISSSG